MKHKPRTEKDRRYALSAKGVARRRRYERSAKGRARARRWRKSSKGRRAIHRYNISPKGQAKRERSLAKAGVGLKHQPVAQRRSWLDDYTQGRRIDVGPRFPRFR